jgi:translation initiation factor IF-3
LEVRSIRRYPVRIQDKTRINENIRVKEVRLITEGNNLGVVDTEAALKMAGEQGLDLVEVAPEANPPVCKIMDYGKYKYQKSKRDHEAKKSQHIIHVKEIKFRPKTDEHDFQFKLDHIKKFLEAKNKVKVTLIFRGREASHIHLGMRLLDRIVQEIDELGIVEQSPQREGRVLVMILAPKQ